MSISIRKEENGFILVNHRAGATQPTWVFQGDFEEKIDEMLTQARLILLEEPDETPLPNLNADTLKRIEAPNDPQI